MSLAIGPVAAIPAATAHSKPTNFGSLVSAIRHGDLDGAQNAFEALSELAPKAPGPLRKGTFDALKKALAESDLQAAEKALKELQQGRVDGTAGGTSTPSVRVPGSTVNILV